MSPDVDWLDHIEDERERLADASYAQVVAAFIAAANAMHDTIATHGRYGSEFPKRSAEHVLDAIEDARDDPWVETDARLDVRMAGRKLRSSRERTVRILREARHVRPGGGVEVAGRVVDGPNEGAWFIGTLHIDPDRDDLVVRATRFHDNGVVLGDEVFPDDLRPQGGAGP